MSNQEAKLQGPQSHLLEFYAYEYMGIEVYRFPGIGIVTNPADLLPIKDKDGLKVGDPIMVSSPFEHGYWVGEVKAWEDGTLYGAFSNGKLLGCLDYGIDDRQCWVCTGFGNVSGLAKIEFL